MASHKLQTLTLSLALLPGACTGPGERVEEVDAGPTQTSSIDARSYALGAIGAFAEMVDAGVKTLALSTPLDPPEMDRLMADAERIAGDHGVGLFREDDFLVTDLFSADLTDGKHVLFICRGDTWDRYKELKAVKRQLVESGEYTGEPRREIAREFGRLLSYSEAKIEALLEAGGLP